VLNPASSRTTTRKRICAGDRGMLHPELTESATRAEAAPLPAAEATPLSTGSQIGLEAAADAAERAGCVVLGLRNA
jgi:hypothetical protein